MTYRAVVMDIWTSLKKNFDDADILLPQVLYWVQVVANNMRYRDFETTESSSYLSVFNSVPILTDSRGQQYFELPKQIMDFSNDRGIQFISYNHETGCCCVGPNWVQTFFQPTTPIRARQLYGDEYQKPTPQRPYFYRVAEAVDNVKVNRVYLLGTECIKVKDVQIGILATIDPSDVCSLDEEMPISDEMISSLITEVLSLGRFVVQVPSERVNEGSDESKAIFNNVPNITPQADQQ